VWQLEAGDLLSGWLCTDFALVSASKKGDGEFQELPRCMSRMTATGGHRLGFKALKRVMDAAW